MDSEMDSVDGPGIAFQLLPPWQLFPHVSGHSGLMLYRREV